MAYDFKTVEEAAEEYVRVLINSRPNGWGQHIDRLGRQSHYLLMDITRQFGSEVATPVIQAAIQKGEKR